MKILSLNIWGGRQGQEFFDYINDQKNKIDVFCFQEVFSSTENFNMFGTARINIFKELQDELLDFNSFFISTYEGWVDMDKVDFKVISGQAIFVRKNIEVIEDGYTYIYGNEKTEIQTNFQNEPKTLQYVKLNLNGKNYLIINIHGLWYPGTKVDSSDRLEQSKKILEFAQKFNCFKIIAGDFNLIPETQSIKMFEADYKNLIKDFNIINTRNKISWGMHNNVQYFADFTFVSKDLEVLNFEVPYNEASDHLPMVLEIKD